MTVSRAGASLRDRLKKQVGLMSAFYNAGLATGGAVFEVQRRFKQLCQPPDRGARHAWDALSSLAGSGVEVTVRGLVSGIACALWPLKLGNCFGTPLSYEVSGDRVDRPGRLAMC